MKHSLVVPIALLLAAVGARGQLPPAALHDGQQVTLTGRLVMEPQGRLQFVTVKTATAYVPVFEPYRGGNVRGDALHEIGLAGYRDYALLYGHRGQQVTVTGRLGIDNASPYYWRGTRLQIASLRLADGNDLLGAKKPANEPIAIDTGTYQAAVTLPADLAAPWVYTANGQPEREGRFLSCSSNGGGDVVNCFCAKGFHAVAGHSGTASKPARMFRDGSTAQFDAGDDKHAIELSVTCSR